jgi:glycerate 2-kinase
MRSGESPRRVLVAADSFKGTFRSAEVNVAIGAAFEDAGWTANSLAVADGGEGTMEALVSALGGIYRAAQASDPLGRAVDARWALLGDGRAAVEVAEASGLWRVAEEDRDAWAASTYGTGELIAAAATAGAERVLVAAGGSATTDGGAGLLRSLGAEVSDDLATVDLGGLDGRLSQTRLRIACDVTNPLLGPTGAAAIYGPQKGASPADVLALDMRCARFADALERAAGRRERDTPGAGAAGGVGFAMLALAGQFAELELRPGVELVMEEAGFDRALATSQLVITGEGRIDAQTAYGKTALGVAKRARVAGKPCIALGGGVTPEGIVALAAVGAIAMPIVETPQDLETAIAAGTAPVERCGERIARLFSAAMDLPAATPHLA